MTNLLSPNDRNPFKKLQRQRSSHTNLTKSIISILILFSLVEAGFSEEWTSTNEERSRQRQVEVQANIGNNPNRPTEYRTVTTPPTQTQFSDQDAEERMFIGN